MQAQNTGILIECSERMLIDKVLLNSISCTTITQVIKLIKHSFGVGTLNELKPEVITHLHAN